MDMGEILSRIAEKSKELGLSEQGLAKAAGLSKDGIRNWRRRYEAGEEAAGANVSSVSKIAATLGVSELWLLHGIGESEGHPTIAIAGKVGAGAQVPVFDAYPKGAGPQVECPPGLSPHGVVAVEVEGDSMEPVFSAGDLLFYTRDTSDGVPSEAIGRRCICEDEAGMGWVKVIREGREDGIFDLHSFNDTSPTMYGVRLKWASPVRLHWPSDLARKSQ